MLSGTSAEIGATEIHPTPFRSDQTFDGFKFSHSKSLDALEKTKFALHRMKRAKAFG